MANETWEKQLDYQANQRQMIAEAREARERLHIRAAGWAEGYEMGKAEQAEREVSKRWHDAICAFVIGAICGFVIAAILTVASA